MNKRLWLLTRIWTLLLMLPVLTAPTFAATQVEIDQAIQNGLAWMVTQQNPTSGRFGGGNYYLANTATAVLAFENEGHFPGGGTAYSINVEKGLDYIFTKALKVEINPQTSGYSGRNDDPDTNGNGLGVYFREASYMYETGLVMQAIVASNTPNREVTTGICNGMTYREVMEDLVDFLAWSQIDGGPGRGGWRYGIYNNGSGYGDNSVAQWPVLGLVAAEQWGIYAPQFVKDEMEYWVSYIQHASGGSGYHTPGTFINISKTGGLLVEFYYLGDTKDTPRAQRALTYINSRWSIPPSGYYGNKSHPYAMFSVFKGLELMDVPVIPAALATPDTPAGDWWGDYSHHLVNTQIQPGASLGYWSGYSLWNRFLATPWYIVILQASVFPVSVDVEVPGLACDLTGYEVNVHYSVERFTANGTLSVYRDGLLYDVVTLTEFKGSDTETYNIAPEAPGDHTWQAVLEVTGGGISTQAEDTDGGTVYETPQVAGIPDQVAPFTTFDLDDFQTCDCSDVDWSASGVPAGWTVTIDAENIVTVSSPEGAFEPAEITFAALFHWPGIDCVDSDTAIFAPNRPPTPHPGKIYPEEKYVVPEGGSVTLDGSASSDPDGDVLASFEWDLDEDGIFEVAGETVPFSAADLDGPAEVYVYLKVCDEHGACAIGLAEVKVDNIAPTVGPFSSPMAPVPVGTVFDVVAAYADPCSADTHTVQCTMGNAGGAPHDGNASAGVATVSSEMPLDHIDYAEPGIYTVQMTVADDDGGMATAGMMVIAYDPDAGFVTGGGWLNSPAGAYRPVETLAGRANFGFVSKYQKGKTVPTGQTEFHFQAGSLNFHSNSYEYLVVTGSNYARFKGVGTINGEGAYNFMLWAGDNTGPEGLDTFRIRIWAEEEVSAVETDVYDNGMDQQIAGGSIKIQTKSK